VPYPWQREGRNLKPRNIWQFCRDFPPFLAHPVAIIAKIRQFLHGVWTAVQRRFLPVLHCLSSAMHCVLVLFVCFFCHATEVGAAGRQTVFVDVVGSLVFINRFSCSFLRFSEHKIVFSTSCIKLKFVVRCRRNFGGNLQKFRKFLKISRKSLC